MSNYKLKRGIPETMIITSPNVTGIGVGDKVLLKHQPLSPEMTVISLQQPRDAQGRPMSVEIAQCGWFNIEAPLQMLSITCDVKALELWKESITQ